MMQVNSISDQNRKQSEMDRKEDRERWKMAIHYLTIRLSKWAGSQTVLSFVMNPLNAYRYVHDGGVRGAIMYEFLTA